MRSSSSITLAVAGALLVAGCAPAESTTGGATGASEFPAEALEIQASDAGKLSIEVRTSPKQPPHRGTSSVELRIEDEKGEPVEGLTISALPWMPDMGHGASVKPVVKEQGDGKYRLDDVTMFMPGRWELRTKVSGPLDDSATILFQIP